ncbi:MerR family transcriptional regulator [Hippea jasoniae]|uniref:DNA-binding protein n=1 Tax=Hippea jasoniae TaxID=944479 RepID=UPI00054F424E|nr:DNA-binding protein [Hippea jasoniae]
MRVELSTKYLKMEKSTLYNMAREGKIPVVKIEIGKNNSDLLTNRCLALSKSLLFLYFRCLQSVILEVSPFKFKRSLI